MRYLGQFWPDASPVYQWSNFPGYVFGQRKFDTADAIQEARDRQKFLIERAKYTDLPEFKYLSPSGRFGELNLHSWGGFLAIALLFLVMYKKDK